MTEALAMDETTRVVLRTGIARDVPFIVNSWLKSNRKRYFARIDRRVYFHWHHRMLEALVPASKVIIACDREDPDKLFGYAVAANQAPILVVHFAYVKAEMRRAGIGTALMRELLERFDPTALAWTHESEHWTHFMRRADLPRLPGIFNPYLAFLQWGGEEKRR